jgi:hypothetical protein
MQLDSAAIISESIVALVQLDAAAIASGMGEPHLDRAPVELRASRLGPLDEGDASRADVVGEQRRILSFQVGEPVQVDVADDHVRAAIAVADAEGRARDWILDAERARRTADEGRLAGTEIAPNQHDVAAGKRSRKLSAKRFGLSRIGGLEDSRSHDKTLRRKARAAERRVHTR